VIEATLKPALERIGQKTGLTLSLKARHFKLWKVGACLRADDVKCITLNAILTSTKYDAKVASPTLTYLGNRNVE
jgi:hypothetical protein